ncbi:Serine/threonine-protein kinase EDR1 [Senna tora]|uniref:Serine/threonine-protein kinase EDR1 n=1 Tax=Senna tora TaxID=362788 RepID=A0A835CD88_9FABA|nr:Serine/threonine-protein kinase EDR1 [Senna tora]
MNSEAPSARYMSDASIENDNNEDNICPQTGEEFSADFYRDRFGLRRLPITPDHVDIHRQPINRLGFDSNNPNNYQVGYEDLSRVVRLRRADSDSNNSDLSDFAPTTGGYLNNAAETNNLNRFQWERGGIGIGQVSISGRVSEDVYSDHFSSTPTASAPIYIAESPQSCHPYLSSFSDASFYKKIKFLCSFGGRILPRPNDGKLRYVGGETRIISITKNITWEQLMEKTYAICNHSHIIKYQLPGEDLDALISVCSDEDLHHMIEEYEEQERLGGSQRLRIFLISSNEPESPTSIEARVNQTGEVDYQYVVAVNGMVDPSPRKSSSGQSLTSQTSQLGNASDYNSPRLFKESPTSAFTWDMKDRSPMSPRVGGGLFSKPGLQFLSALQVPVKSFNHQSPSSPISRISVQPKDPKISNVELLMDQTCNASSNESLFPFVMDRVQCDNSLYREDASYVDPHAYYNNLAQGPPLPNYHRNNQHIMEADHPRNANDDVQFHIRSHSEDFVSSAVSGQFDTIFETPKRTNESYHFDKSVSHTEGTSSVSNNRDRGGSYSRLLHAISDPLLQKSDECFENHLQPSPAVKGNVSPLVEISSSFRETPLLQGEIIDNKVHRDEYQILPHFEMIDKCKGILDPSPEILLCADNNNACSDDIERFFEGSTEATLHDNIFDFKDLDYINGKQGACLSSAELQSSEFNLLASPNFESTINLREKPHVLQLNTTASDFLMRSQTSTMYPQFTMLETESNQTFPLGSSNLQHIATQNDKESILLISNTDMGSASIGEAFLPNENPTKCPYEKNEKTSINKDSNARHSNELSDQSQLFVGSQEIKKLKPIDIVNRATNSISSGTQPCSKVVLDVDKEVEAESASPEKEESESVSPESQSELANDDSNNFNKLVGSTAAEMEAELYGLQIIKNADIEELRELGSGTFGTVYHGKWRGTDVAIKRLKSSCFTGRLSEQERLTKDFWREAKILSTLHHPNVVAFYGVVPDGPGDTLATLTEYMVHGSLRNVLIRKERVLDRRKRLMIAMDAAFGMEYLHFKNIVHFDLKCDNLLVNLGDPERPVCKVGDFGLSRIKRNTLVSGGVRGTLPWMAPELLDGNNSGVSEKVDVFSFGIAMWEILTGEEPYANLHCGAIIGGIVNNTLRPSIPKRCDSEWKKLMEECWSPDPAARPSFTEITHRFRIMQAALPKKRHNLPTR